MTGVSVKVSGSSVTRAIRLLGDRWSILVIRDAFQGIRRFEQFLERSGASRATLTRRLQSLVATGVLVRVRYSAAPPRWEYRLTPKGRDLFPLSMVAWDWERRWAPRGAGIPLKLRHSACGHDMRAEAACSNCGQVLRVRDVDFQSRPGVAARAVARGTRSRRLSALTGASRRGTQESLTHIVDIVGDPWTPLVLAAAFFGVRRFDDFQRELGIATNILATRLELLVKRKVFKKTLYLRQPPRHEYRLTEKGRELFPYAIVLNAWGDKWLATRAGPPFRFVHRACGGAFTPVVRCSHCSEALAPGTVAAPGSRIAARVGAP